MISTPEIYRSQQKRAHQRRSDTAVTYGRNGTQLDPQRGNFIQLMMLAYSLDAYGVLWLVPH